MPHLMRWLRSECVFSCLSVQKRLCPVVSNGVWITHQCFHDFCLFPPHFFFSFQPLSSEVATAYRLHPSGPVPCLLYSSALLLHCIPESSNPGLDQSGRAVMFVIGIFVLRRMPFLTQPIYPGLGPRSEVDRRCPSDGCFYYCHMFLFFPPSLPYAIMRKWIRGRKFAPGGGRGGGQVRGNAGTLIQEKLTVFVMHTLLPTLRP